MNLLALAVCTGIAVPFAAGFFWLGVTWTRYGQVEDVLTFLPRHPSCQRSNVRLLVDREHA